MLLPKIVILAVVLTGAIACGKKDKEKTSPAAQTATASPEGVADAAGVQPAGKSTSTSNETSPQGKMWIHSLSCPSRKDTSLDKKRVIEHRAILLERQVRQTLRKDCSNNVIGERPEEAKKPVAEITLSPKAWLPNFKGASVYIHNRTTCTGPNAELAKTWSALKFEKMSFDEQGKPVVRFWVNAMATQEQMHVARHTENYIDYEFAGCSEDDLNPDGSCARAFSVEKGTLVLKVSYAEQTVEPGQEVVECEAGPVKSFPR